MGGGWGAGVRENRVWATSRWPHGAANLEVHTEEGRFMGSHSAWAKKSATCLRSCPCVGGWGREAKDEGH